MTKELDFIVIVLVKLMSKKIKFYTILSSLEGQQLES